MPLGVTSMGLSLAVNALVSGLMVSRIWHVYRRTSGCTTANIVKSPLAWIVSALLESAVALFIAQLIYMVLYQLGHPAFALVAGPVTIIYVSARGASSLKFAQR
jgi:hypothetical protein